MQLGISGTSVVMRERRRHYSLDVLLHDAVRARPGVEHVLLGVGEHIVDSPTVALEDDRLSALIG